jgi:GDP-4-dehydro-6-deoxy-D-mannose reductase
MKVLVTGGTGFAGRYLLDELLENGYEVVATTSQPATIEGVEILNLDLSDSKAVEGINFDQIDAVYNLAGLAAVGRSFDEPYEYLRVNASIQINLFEACLRQNARPRMLVISSANIYCADELPLTEQSRILPVSPYAVSKVAQEYIGQYYGTRSFEVVTARAFNHMGPGQAEGFITADLAKQVAQIEQSGRGEILVGNLDAKRDYTDVRDIASAYRLLAEKGRAGEVYNVCSGKAVSGHQILEGLLAHSRAHLTTKVDQSLFRPVDKPEIYGSNDKIYQDTGWRPEILLEQTLEETLAYWRAKFN